MRLLVFACLAILYKRILAARVSELTKRVKNLAFLTVQPKKGFPMRVSNSPMGGDANQVARSDPGSFLASEI